MSTEFQTYSEYKDSTSSEKITLAHVHAFQQLFNFTLDSGNIYKRVTSRFVNRVKRLGSQLTRVDTLGEVDDETKFYFDIKASTLYLYSTTSDLADEKIIAEYRLFFSNLPINLSWDLSDNGDQVEYEPRIRRSPRFKSEVGVEQQGISITGIGNLLLENTDGYFDDIYDILQFEQKPVQIYSFNRELPPSEAKIFYRGFIVDKKFTDRDVTLRVQDSLFKLDQKIPLETYVEGSGVSEQFIGEFKRRIYGRLDSLLIRSIDQVGNGFNLTGTTTNVTTGVLTVTVTGGNLLDELSPNDTVTINNFEYTVETVDSDTQFTVSDSDGIQTVHENATISNLPARPWRKKNREYLIAGHAIKQVTTTLVRHPQLNRIEVTDSEGIEAGDILDIGSQVAEVDRVSGNLITTRFNLSSLEAAGATVLKRAVLRVYVEGEQLPLDDIDNISNTAAQASVTISDLSEFNLARNRALPSGVNVTFTNGSRTLTTTDDIDFRELLQPRDWIKKSNDADTEFLEILDVDEKTIILRTPWTDVTVSETAVIRTPSLISDDSNVSSDVLGKTKDGTPEGEWIKTGAEIILDLLEESDLDDFTDSSGFAQASQDANFLMSMALPNSIRSTSLPSVRDVVNDINQSIFGSLVLNNSLLMTYNILDVSLESTTLRTIEQGDEIKFKMKSNAANLFKSAIARYSFRDFDPIVKDETARVIDFTSEFVSDFETSSETDELDLFVYRERDAQELTERHVYFNSLSQSIIEIESSLLLADINMGDKVLLKFRRMYNRLGDLTSRNKVGIVIGIDRSGSTIKMKISDLGNLFNRSAIISEDTAADFSAQTPDGLMVSSHITDDNGIIDDNEQTNHINLIS